jgi:hypothetical protein
MKITFGGLIATHKSPRNDRICNAGGNSIPFTFRLEKSHGLVSEPVEETVRTRRGT